MEVGDIVTVEGPKTVYNGTVELVDVTVINIQKSLVKVEGYDPEDATIPLEGGNVAVNLSCKTSNGISVEIPEEAKSWLGIVSITGGAEPVVTFHANANNGGDRNATVIFKTTDDKGKEYTAQATIYQTGAIVAATVAQFLEAPVGDTQYRITGVITKVANPTYGNVYVRDWSGETYVYGIGAKGDFEAAGPNGWDLLNGAQNNYWMVGSATNNGGSQSMYITDDGIANNYSGAASYVFATRTFDLAAGSYVCTYDWKAHGESSFDFLRVALVPAGTVLTPGDYSGFDNTAAVPAGGVALDGGARLNLQDTWQTVSQEFDITTPGTYSMVFLWRNDGSVYNQTPAAIDNVSVIANTCPRVQGLASTTTGTTYITINWTDVATPTAWQVRYGVNGDTTSTLLSVTSHPVTISGLTAQTTYSFTVRPICSGDDTGAWCPTTYIATGFCDGATEAINYDPSATATTSTYGPIGYSLYNYSYVQTIIDSADMASIAGDITGFAFNVGTFLSASSTKFNNMTVFMSNVSESNLTNGFIHPDTAHTFIKVIDSACFNYTESGWQVHSFDTAFTWDGHSNVLFAVKRDNGSYSGSQTFSAHTATASKMRYIYQDSGPYDYATVTGGTASSTVGDIKFISCGSANCEQPVIMNVDTAETSITIEWVGTSAGYEVAIVEDAWVEPAAGTAVADTFYTFTGLVGSTSYYVAVRGVCGGANSDWTYVPVTTLRHPCAMPTGVTVTNPTYSGATVSWTAGEEETAWEVNVSCSSPVYDHTYTVNDTPTVEVTGLDNGITYKVIVRALCDADWFSPWTDTVDLTTTTCPIVTGVTASGITATSATISWNSTGAASYEVEYGDMGFHTGDGHTVTSTTTSVVIDQYLEEQSTYDVFVRSVCADGVYSGWSEKYTFRTTAVGIEEVVNGNVVLYPNPASTMVTIRGIEGESTVTVVDLNGREVYKNTANSDLTIDLTGYAKGAYFVRITGESTTAIRKLIVK